MPQDEPDTHNFSTSSEHRLPAISGAQALQDEIRRARGIPTSLPGLDSCLSPHNSPVASNGIRRGFVTEIYGPPGSGKTTFGIEVAINAIHDLGKAVWISAGSPLMQRRVHDINAAYILRNGHEPPSSPPDTTNSDDLLEQQFIYKQVQSLPHLLVLLMHPTDLFPPPNTATLILDGLPNCILSAFPRQVRDKDATNSILQERAAKRAAGKRFQLIENLASALSRLAASRHIAVIILNSTTTSMRGGRRAILKPALGGQVWDAAVNTRIVLYRDLYPRHLQTKFTIKEKRGYRLAEVVRLGAKDTARDPVPFVIETGGMRELEVYDDTLTAAAPPLTIDPEDDEFLLQIRTSQSGAQPPPLPTALPALPTASQLLQEEQAATEAGPIPMPLLVTASGTATATTTAPEQQTNQPPSSEPRPSKRKALEIADSEDEDDDVGGELTLPAQPVALAESNGTASSNERTEDMLFDVHERRHRTTTA